MIEKDNNAVDGWDLQAEQWLTSCPARLINLTKALPVPPCLFFSLQRRSGCGFLWQQRDQRRRVPVDLLPVQRQSHAGRCGQSGR